MQSDRKQIKNYVERMFGQDSGGNLVVFERDLSGERRRHAVFPYADREIVFDFLAAQPDNVHRYLAVALHDGQAFEEQTRRGDTACALAFLALDIDLATGVHAATNLPKTEEQALGLLNEADLPEPTLVIHSGGGLYPIWQFQQPLLLESKDDRSRIQRLWSAWYEQARITWERHGLKLDPIADLARVLRVPGTFNPKTKPAKPVRILGTSSDRLWTLEQLEDVVADRVASSSNNSPRSGEHQLADTLRQEMMSGDEDACKNAAGALAMISGCSFLKGCDEGSERLTEPQWKDAADLLAHIPEGRRYFHNLSSRDPRYSYREAEAKLDHASKYRPKLCETIAETNSECNGCLFREGMVIRTPVQLAKSEPGLVPLQGRYVLDAKTGLFFDISTGRDKTKDDFDRSFTRNMQKKRLASTTFRNSALSCLADEHDFLVGNDKLIVEENGIRTFNTWQDGGVAAVEGDASIWHDHLRYLLPGEGERKWVLQYLAHLVQRPAAKIKSAIVLQSKQGVGKNLLVRAVKRMFHENDVREVYGGILGERWQAELGNTRLLALDELQIDELKTAYNRLKRWTTEEIQSVERKGVDAFNVRTPRGIIIMTNSDKPMAIEHDDRRLFVCKVEAAKREDAYYSELWQGGMSDESVAAFKHYLLHLDLSDFDANAEPPLTGAKEELIRASASLLEQVITELRETGSAPFNRQVYLAEDVASAVEERMRRTVTVQQITPILKKLGDCKRSTKTSVPRLGRSPRGYVWAWQEVERWLNASSDEVRTALVARDVDVMTSGLMPIVAAAVQVAN
ncbi:primase-helicase family protein [Mesorhizobium sp. M0618]|uniref:primase-helicase family protein n=1 Tax=unclassified Mesorhizobium TaxID=325217 RepID=UPI00333964F2